MISGGKSGNIYPLPWFFNNVFRFSEKGKDNCSARMDGMKQCCSTSSHMDLYHSGANVLSNMPICFRRCVKRLRTNSMANGIKHLKSGSYSRSIIAESTLGFGKKLLRVTGRMTLQVYIADRKIEMAENCFESDCAHKSSGASCCNISVIETGCKLVLKRHRSRAQ
jgi:hypothetical protein